MKKTILSIFGIFALILTTNAQNTTWNVDPSHSSVNFSVSHLVISEVDGTFNKFSGNIVSKTDDFSEAKVNFEIDANSISTRNEQRDGHLKSEDFFYTEKHPKISFESSSFKKDGNKYILKGKLTMRGVTKNVTLDVKHGGVANDAYGNTKAGFKISGEIDRTDFGVAYNSKTEHGGLTIGKDVTFVIKLELVKVK